MPQLPAEFVLAYDDLEMNRLDRTVTRGGRVIALTAKEFALLEYLLRHAGQRVTRPMITASVWKLSFDGLTNVVDVYINYLRKKIDRGSPNKLIHTVRGVGISWVPDSVALHRSEASNEPRSRRP